MMETVYNVREFTNISTFLQTNMLNTVSITQSNKQKCE